MNTRFYSSAFQGVCKTLTFAVLSLWLVSSALAQDVQQETLNGLQLFDPAGPIRVTNVQLIGIEKHRRSNIIYTFVHPGGGVQRVTGPILTGGADPEDLLSIGSAEVMGNNRFGLTAHRWVAKEFASPKANFYINPISTSTGGHLQDPIAKPGEILPYDTLRPIFKEVSRPLPDWAIDLKNMLEAKSKPQPEAPAYANTYYQTVIYTGLSGEIAQVSCNTYTLKPRSDWDKGLAPSPYASSLSYARGKALDGLFGEDICFKATSGPKNTHDPVTGNAVVMGGLKYRKDKTKDNSEYYEFRLIVVDKSGSPIGNHYYQSTEPLVIKGVYPIEGSEISPGITEVTHAVFLLQGGGDKNITGINAKLLRVFVIDMKTGELVSQSSVELPQGAGAFTGYRPLSSGAVEISALFPANAEGLGMSFLTVSPSGIANVQNFTSETVPGQSLKLEENGKTAQALRSLSSYVMSNNSILVVKQFVKFGTDPSTQKQFDIPVGYAVFKYNADGSLVNFQGLGNDPALKAMLPLPERKYPGEESLSFMCVTKDASGKNLVTFLKIDAKTLASTYFKLPSTQCMASAESFYINENPRQVYVLTQAITGGGLFIHSFAY